MFEDLCVHNLSPVQSLRERRSGGRESIRGPQQLGLCEGSVYCQGVRSVCGRLLFGDSTTKRFNPYVLFSNFHFINYTKEVFYFLFSH